MTQNKNIASDKEISGPKEQARQAFDGLIANQIWSRVDRKITGKSSSVRHIAFIDPMTESQVNLMETQSYVHVFGAAIKAGDPERSATWIVRERPESEGSAFDPRAIVTYVDGDTDSRVTANYYNGSGSKPAEGPYELNYFYKKPEIYPNPQIMFHQADGLSEMAFLMRYRVPESFVEDVEFQAETK